MASRTEQLDTGYDVFTLERYDQINNKPEEPVYTDIFSDIYEVKPNNNDHIPAEVYDVHMIDKFVAEADQEEKRYVDEWYQEALYRVDKNAIPYRPGQRAKTPEELTENNAAARYIFGDLTQKELTTLGAWRKHLVPSAMALDILQNPDSLHLMDEQKTPVSEEQRPYFKLCLDAIGIRSRASVMSMLIQGYTEGHDTERHMHWLSLASGAADPVLKAAQNLNKNNDQKDINIDLVDLDERALDYASLRAARLGYDGQINTVRENLFNEASVQDALKQKKSDNPEENYDVVDILGFFEYLPDRDINQFPSASTFLQRSYKYLKPGGILIFGNMQDTHPGLDFTIGAVEWPYIRPRSTEKIVDMVDKAGIDTELMSVYTPSDGVYAVAMIQKPE